MFAIKSNHLQINKQQNFSINRNKRFTNQKYKVRPLFPHFLKKIKRRFDDDGYFYLRFLHRFLGVSYLCQKFKKIYAYNITKYFQISGLFNYNHLKARVPRSIILLLLYQIIFVEGNIYIGIYNQTLVVFVVINVTYSSNNFNKFDLFITIKTREKLK